MNDDQANNNEATKTDFGHKIICVENRVSDKKESKRNISSTSQPVVDEKHLYQTESNISENKLVEVALRESEEKYKELVENAASIILKWDRSGRILFLNEYGLEFFGYSQEETIGESVIGTIVPELEKGGRNLIEVIDDIFINPSNHEKSLNENMRKNGSRVWINWAHRPILDNAGRVTGMFSVGTDITERKRAEEEREQLLSAIEQSGETIVITDTEGTIRYTNPAFEKVTGYTCDEVLGQNMKLLKSGEQDDIFYRDMWKLVSDGKTWRGRLINKKKDGSLFIEDASISPVVNELGDIVNYVAVKRDITEQLSIEHEKAQLEEQYFQAQKVESIGRLAGGVAHDLNNLLSPILGYSEMLLDTTIHDDPRKNSLEQIVQASLKARDLVHQLLAFARRQTLAYKPMNLNKSINDFEKLLRRTIREDIALEVIPGPNIRNINADSVQIEQVIMNLAVNAEDAMPNGGKLVIETGVVEIDKAYTAVHPGAQTGQYVMMSVSDTGCGIDKKIRSNIFEPFFSTKGDQGTGLGLATVYGIIKQHGGNIWVYSEPEKGTTFKIYLPVSEETHVEKSELEKPTKDLRGHETVLIVEDNVQVKNLVHEILKTRGYKVLMAENGREAMTLLAAHDAPVDLLLTDVIMPEINGKELFARITKKRPDMKVLYMSGYTANVIAHHGVLDEKVQFIQKPFSATTLAAKAREVLNGSVVK
jgi:PAS domain S-box-containing protein